MVKGIALENGVPAFLVGKVLDYNNVEMFLPLGMSSEDVITGGCSADSSSHFVAVLNESLDDVSGYERVCSGEKGGRHSECLLVNKVDYS